MPKYDPKELKAEFAKNAKSVMFLHQDTLINIIGRLDRMNEAQFMNEDVQRFIKTLTENLAQHPCERVRKALLDTTLSKTFPELIEKIEKPEYPALDLGNTDKHEHRLRIKKAFGAIGLTVKIKSAHPLFIYD